MNFSLTAKMSGFCSDSHKSHTINEEEYVHKEWDRLDHCPIHSNKEVLAHYIERCAALYMHLICTAVHTCMRLLQ